MLQQWDEILRMIATIKLKEVTASDLFRRLHSYSKQQALYRVLKAFGQVPKTASEFDPQNWWTKWGDILGVAQSPKIQSIKGDKRNGLSRLVPLLEFNQRKFQQKMRPGKSSASRS